MSAIIKENLLFSLEKNIEGILKKKKSGQKIVVLFSGGIRSLLLLHKISKMNLSGIHVVHIHTGKDPETLIKYIEKIDKFLNVSIKIIYYDMCIEVEKTNSEQFCESQIINPLHIHFSDLSKIIFILGSKGNSEDRFYNSLCTLSPIQNIFTPLFNVNQEEIWNYLEKEGVPLFSLYKEEYKKTDYTDNLKNKMIGLPEDPKSEDLIKEKLRKLGYL
jgi:3'-phosphoadenosine 5'-phosphosulfate sulfotransferase (PAPS reductase)/FAD synthetase